ncbi:hypothetical protein RclHR1_04040007 [Rhizophagus clarus]|uniref:Sentrin-specific protease 8 n=1 Tax=Rhizophagus clarus TaxID=94130 RepID=A0A2Z6S920_9GLOM|nr:hypothetical protein RclHR1_04040007 [Rhizophagus clarus]GES88039.1 sentrin-specific protease 8 [Rhizophagus clarus]
MLTATLYYKDAMLTPADYYLLYDDRWLNDQCVDFYLEYLEYNSSVKEESKVKPYLLRASMSFLIANIEDAKYLSKALPKQIFSSDIIFIPVNNKQSLESYIGGSHWSLLVYVKENNKFLYYDSANDMNFDIANKFADKISGVLEVKRNDIVIVNTPQQKNGSDCGVFVLSITDQFYQRIIESQSNSDQVDFEKILEVDVQNLLSPSNMRKKIRNLVNELEYSK